MAITLSTTTRNAQLDAIRAAIDGGSGAGTLTIYDGVRPSFGGAATNVCATFTLSDPCAPSAASGVLTFSSMTQSATAASNYTASWFRISTSAGTAILDGRVTTTGGGGDLELITDSILAGQTVSITSLTITDGNG